MSGGQMPINYPNYVDNIIKQYEDGNLTLPDGFQKDVIQNAIGAKKTEKFKNWSCDISLVTNEKGTFIIIEDKGTHGLIGQNLTQADIVKYQNEGKLNEKERLARFSSLFNSGGNTGAGLYGIGKTIYSAASKDYGYYFDALRDDGIYVANSNLSGIMQHKALENNEGKEYIYRETGFKPKDTVGTRIIITNPKDEIKNAMLSGEMTKLIQASWWRIIEKFDDTCYIAINGKKITAPDYKKYATKKYDLPNIVNYEQGYRVKNFGFYYYENGDNEWKGISYYRKGMKIGDVPLKITDVPSKIKDKYWGYIEVDDEWEALLAEDENTVHSGINRLRRDLKTFKTLRNFCSQRTNQLFIDWGFKKDKENEDEKLNKLLNEVTEDIQDLLENLGYETLGSGPKKSDFDVRWQNINYPNDNTEEVTTNDKISFTIRIKNDYYVDKKFEYKLYVINADTKETISEIDSDKIKIESGSVFIKDYIHTVTTETSARYEANKIILTVKVLGSGKLRKKELIYFYDINKPDNHRENVTLTLHDQCIFPRENSRRVNFGESIENVCYRIENKQNCLLKYRLNVSIHNMEDATHPKILDIGHQTGEVKPYEESITPFFEDIIFNEEIYKAYLEKGIVELRARLIANEDNDMYEKGEVITSYYFKIFLNCDEKNGKLNPFDHATYNEPDNFKRSWSVVGGKKIICLNNGHPAYLDKSENEELQREYIYQEMLKQIVLIYLAEGKYDMFGISEDDYLKLDPYEAANVIMDKIESIYYENFKRGDK